MWARPARPISTCIAGCTIAASLRRRARGAGRRSAPLRPRVGRFHHSRPPFPRLPAAKSLQLPADISSLRIFRSGGFGKRRLPRSSRSAKVTCNPSAISPNPARNGVAAKPYDPTLKALVETEPESWPALLAVPLGRRGDRRRRGHGQRGRRQGAAPRGRRAAGLAAPGVRRRPRRGRPAAQAARPQRPSRRPPRDKGLRSAAVLLLTGSRFTATHRACTSAAFPARNST